MSDKSIPIDAQLVEYKIKIVENQATVTLSFVHRSWLVFLSSRGGESDLNYEAAMMTTDQINHFRKLVEMGLAIETDLIGYKATKHWRLTDAGRNIVDQILLGDEFKLERSGS